MVRRAQHAPAHRSHACHRCAQRARGVRRGFAPDWRSLPTLPSTPTEPAADHSFTQVFDFARTVQPDLSNYDPDGVSSI